MISQEANLLNKIIKNKSNCIYSLLSKKGKKIYLPKKGVPSQGEESKQTKLNATIGISLYDDKSLMKLNSIKKMIDLDSNEILNYSKIQGDLKLRTKWKELMIKKNPSIKEKISLPIVSVGLTHGLFVISNLFLNENDSIIIPNPYWENYDLMFETLNNVNIKKFNLFNKNNSFNIEGLKKELNKTKKPIILFNFPNNPTGYSLNNEEIKKITNLLKKTAKEKKIIIIFDDAYFGFVYEKNISRESLFSKLHNLDKNILCIKLDATTKEDFVWGFRIGFITYGIKNGNEKLYSALEQKTSGIIRSTVSNPPTISQSLIYKGLTSKNYEKEKEKNYNILKERYNEVKKIIKNKKYKNYFHTLPFNSGYFVCIKLNNINTEKLRKELIKNYSTGVISKKDYIRIAYSSLNKKEIKKVFENIYNVCKEIKDNKK